MVSHLGPSKKKPYTKNACINKISRFFHKKKRFFGSRVGAEKSQKIREIVSFWEVTETSAGPNFAIHLNFLRIFSSSIKVSQIHFKH